MPLEMFRCAPLEVKLTRNACGARHDRAVNEVRHKSAKGQMHMVGNQRCAECPIGAAHLAGSTPRTWPDGAPIETSTPIIPATATSTMDARSEARPDTHSHGICGREDTSGRASDRAPASEAPARPVSIPPRDGGGQVPRRPEPKEERMARPKARTITHDGQTLTFAEWAKKPEIAARGITVYMLYDRLKAGWSAADALTVPKVARSEAARRGGQKRPSTKRAVTEQLDAKFAHPAEGPAPASPPPARRDPGAPLRVVFLAGGVEVARSEDPRAWAAALLALEGGSR